MALRDARRPLLLAEREDVSLILVDGWRRAARSKQLGYERSHAWIPSAAQWLTFCALSSAKN
ncbi:hypothetical protein [Rhodoblastus sp.]|uniref:hypothetical protein n=1 Tax=Rhodoblastus sp. TaxID=1962975 RepID=UPI0035B01C38